MSDTQWFIIELELTLSKVDARCSMKYIKNYSLIIVLGDKSYTYKDLVPEIKQGKDIDFIPE
jgi:hypothetical protein